MKFGQRLFKRQPGGSIIGNLLRGVGDKLTGGVYSQIFRRPDAAPAVAAAAQTPATATPPINSSFVGGLGDIKTLLQKDEPQPEPKKPGLAWFKKNWAYVAGTLVAIGGIWYFFTKKGKSRKRSRA